jgi:hypothetical protein
LRDGLLFEEGGLRLLAFQFRCDQILETIIHVFYAVGGHGVFIDTGTSTYELNGIRFYERSTLAHNTVAIKDINSSQVWSGHRVGKRARVKVLNDFPDTITASHDGYKSQDIIHTRTFQKFDNKIIITDTIGAEGIFYLHFEPTEIIHIKNNLIIGKDYSITFNGEESIECLKTDYSPEFNKRIPNQSVRVNFKNKLETIIE